MFAAFYAATRRLDVQLVESLPELGGQISALYPDKKIFDVAGFVEGTGRELVENLRRQLDAYRDAVTIRLGEEVIGLAGPGLGTQTGIETDQNFTLSTADHAYASRAVLIAMGSGAFTPRRLQVDYDSRLDGVKVHYTVQRLRDFESRSVVVAGGGDAAIDWALTLEPVASHVTLIHRRNNFRALEANVERLKASSVRLLTPYRFERIDDADEGIDVQLHDVKGAHAPRIHADALLVNYGFVSDNRRLSQWGLPVTRGDLRVDEHMQTSIPGIYGIGDAVTYPGKVKLISSGFGEAPTAINHLAETLYPERRQPLHA